MGDDSKIEWTDATWNPVTGCTKVSQGCKHCYAETIANRLWPTQYAPNPDGSPRGFTDIRLHPDRLDQPLRWRRARRIFVNSMSDLFHENIPAAFIAECFAVMAQASQHTFQVLTKRPERMQQLLNDKGWMDRVDAAMGVKAGDRGWCVDEVESWPLPNVQLGISAENQEQAERRVKYLYRLPAAVRFVSAEPLLSPIDFGVSLAYVDWVIVGGESGHGARPMHPDWARSIRDQCQAAGVAFFFKQWGENMPCELTGDGPEPWRRDTNGEPFWFLQESNDMLPDRSNLPPVYFWDVGKKRAGRLLDGRTWDEYPVSLAKQV